MKTIKYLLCVLLVVMGMATLEFLLLSFTVE